MNDYKMKNDLVHKMYKKNINNIFELNNLPYNISKGNSQFLLNEVKNYTKSNKDIVVGGACIDRCEGDIAKLGINFYFDVLSPINFAMENGLGVSIYVDTPVEVFGKTKKDLELWVSLSDRVENFINKLADVLNYKVNIIRRENGISILNELVQNINLSDQEIKGLYDLVPSKKNIYFSNDLLLHFKRSIASYLPNFISQYLGRDISHVIVVEEFSQIKAITKATQINSNVVPNVYVDMPSKSGKSRMHRSPHGKIPIFSKNIINEVLQSPSLQVFLNNNELNVIYQKFNVTSFEELVIKLAGLWDVNETK